VIIKQSTQYWHRLDDGRIQCDLCPRYCKLKSNQKGLCFVRVCEDGEIVLSTYGLSSGFCIDPIEKKPLNHFLPGTAVLSFGTAGCNLACKFCQNWDMSKSREMATLAEEAMPKQIAQAAKQAGCRSVAFTYNDPVIFLEYAIDVAKACRDLNINTVAVSAGYICEEPRREFFQVIDAVNIDLKAFTEEFYWQLTGSHLQTVLETILYLKNETTVWLELTTLIIPGKNDSDNEIDLMCAWILEHLGENVPLHFTGFHPAWKMLDTPETPKKSLDKARAIALRAGLNYVYTGNVYDKKAQSTYCAACKALLIGRDWYELSEWNIRATSTLGEGVCKQCGALCHGHFESEHGLWGAKRKAINISDFSI